MTLGVVHLAGAAGGGAAAGALVALIGDALSLGRWRFWVVGVVAATTLLVSLTRAHFEFGRPCQVPRKWSRSLPAYRRYLMWGAMLGAGMVTLIPYPAYLLLLAAQATASVPSAAVAGALFGLLREAPALLGLASSAPEETMEVLPRLRPAWRAGNVILIAAGGVLLAVAGL